MEKSSNHAFCIHATMQCIHAMHTMQQPCLKVTCLLFRVQSFQFSAYVRSAQAFWFLLFDAFSLFRHVVSDSASQLTDIIKSVLHNLAGVETCFLKLSEELHSG